MTVFDDDVDMWEQAWADRLLKGESIDGDSGLSGLVAAVRATADAPAPAPNAALAALLRDGLPTAEVPAPRRVPEQVRYWGSRTFRVGVAGVAASLAMGAGVATAAAGGGGPLTYVPEPVKRGVDAAVTAVADVLRSEPAAPSPKPPTQPPATSGADDSDGSDKTAPVGPSTAKVPAPATAEAVPSAEPTTADTPEAVPSTPVPTTTPEPAPSEPGPALPPSTLPTPNPQGSPEQSPEGSPEQSPEGSPEQSPEGEGRKPLDNEKSSPSPSPSPSPSEGQDTGEAPAEGEAAPAEGEAQPVGENAPGSRSSEANGEPQDKPGRGELTVQRDAAGNVTL